MAFASLDYSLVFVLFALHIKHHNNFFLSNMHNFVYFNEHNPLLCMWLSWILCCTVIANSTNSILVIVSITCKLGYIDMVACVISIIIKGWCEYYMWTVNCKGGGGNGSRLDEWWVFGWRCSSSGSVTVVDGHDGFWVLEGKGMR